MKASARNIALSGVCGAISCVAMLLTSVLPFAALIFGVMAAVATVLPMLVDGRNLGYSLLTYFASLTVAAISGIFVGNIVAVAPIALFCVPFAVVKVRGESFKITSRKESTETLDSPFEGEEGATVVRLELKGKPYLSRLVKWILYYILLEASVALTFVLTWAMTPGVLDRLFSEMWLFWLTVGLAQLVPPLYDLLLRGCLIAAVKVVRKVVK